MRRLIIASAFSLALTLAGEAQAFSSFTVSHIRITGLQRINLDTAMHYLPIHAGQLLDEQKSTEVIQGLYQTGFFQDVNLARSGDTLVINVVEWPTIGDIKVNGNKEISSDKLKTVLKDLGLQQGQVFNSSVLERVRYSLQSEYDNLGKYNAAVTTKVTPLARNRVKVEINVSEGIPAKIAEIRIIGNHAFSERELLKQFTLSTSNLFTLFSKNDQYSEEKMQHDLEALQSYYLDHGYVKFKVLSKQVTLTPDKKHIYIVVRVQEGSQYHLKNYQITGNIPIDRTEVEKSVLLQPGSVFSRKAVISAQQHIGETLGNHGYAFAAIQIIPVLDDAAQTVSITYSVNPGGLTYVRYINFMSNSKTEDLALRQTLLQMEGGLVNLKNINDSVRNLNVIGFVKEAKQELVPVPGKENQVDMNLHIAETNTATVQVGAGYSTLEKFLVTASLTQRNFLGSGRSLNVNFSNSALMRSYTISYNNPYFTPDGVSQGVSLYYQHYNGDIVTSPYHYNAYGFNTDYGFPITNYDRITGGIGLQRIDLSILNNPRPGQNPPAPYLNLFGNIFGHRFDQVLLSLGYLHNSFDRYIFPTEGTEHALSVTYTLPIQTATGAQPLKYYKASYDVQSYLPLTASKSFIVMGHGGLSYGDGLNSIAVLPFFANYLGGGIDTNVQVAGIRSATLGARDVYGEPIGGNFGMYGSVGLVLPQFTESVRTIFSIQAARLYNTGHFYDSSIDPTSGSLSNNTYKFMKNFRYSAGIQVEWQPPILGTAIEFSLAAPLKKYPGDDVEPFQFTFGANF
jgi:outer membrane protein insertion porin family